VKEMLGQTKLLTGRQPLEYSVCNIVCKHKMADFINKQQINKQQQSAVFNLLPWLNIRKPFFKGAVPPALCNAYMLYAYGVVYPLPVWSGISTYVQACDWLVKGWQPQSS